MKQDIHPQYNNVIFTDGAWELVSKSTMSSRETREVDGVEYFVIPVAISTNSHPFWTGQQKMMDAAGRLDRFNKKYGSVMGTRKKKPE
jgi:large subunit ribosomal protein L31